MVDESSSIALACSVSVVIPVLNPGPSLESLLAMLGTQCPQPPREIILVDSGSTDGSVEGVAGIARVRIVPIETFTHGGARNRGVREATGEIVVFLTQDALPIGTDWLARLTAPFSDPDVGGVYGRQVPHDSAAPSEKFFLADRFPSESRRKRRAQPGDPVTYDLALFSNVCSAVRRELLQKHPFDESLIMAEDLKLSSELLTHGHTIVYCAEAVVRHSHRYTLGGLFRRYFDSAYALQHILASQHLSGQAAIGMSYLRRELPHIVRHHPAYVPRYLLELMMKTAATVVSRLADGLPAAWTRRLSLHAYHWSVRHERSP